MDEKQRQIEFPAWLKRFVFFLGLAVVVGMLVGWRMLFIRGENQVPAVRDRGGLVKMKVGQAEVWVELAETAEEKQTGLSGRDSLAQDQGMLFVYDQAGPYGFWMKGMKFGLDMVWIREGRVVEVTEDVKPPAADNVPINLPVYQAKESVDSMLEVNAGWVQSWGVKVGNEVVVE